ncbi:hypothetical protein HK101_010591, partial [Irineochytrium annulatum]
MFDESLIQSQQSAYSVPGVDETAVIQPKGPKRKVYTMDEEPNKKPKPNAEPKKPRPITSIYVQNLPSDATHEEIQSTFEKYGILMEDLSTGKSRIKLYTDTNGHFKGDALITYFKEESVQLAIDMMDDCEFRYGSGKIKVSKAEFKEKEKVEGGSAGGG